VETLIEGVIGMGQEPGRIVMMVIGGVLMYLGIKKEYEPTLLVPMGLGTILVNFPNSGVLSAGGEAGAFQILFDMGITTELFPLLLFIGIGAMIDFGPLLQNPFLLLFGAAAQFGIFFTIIVAILLGFDLNDAASIGIIGAADGPTSIFVANTLNSKYMGVHNDFSDLVTKLFFDIACQGKFNAFFYLWIDRDHDITGFNCSSHCTLINFHFLSPLLRL